MLSFIFELHNIQWPSHHKMFPAPEIHSATLSWINYSDDSHNFQNTQLQFWTWPTLDTIEGCLLGINTYVVFIPRLSNHPSRTNFKGTCSLTQALLKIDIHHLTVTFRSLTFKLNLGKLTLTELSIKAGYQQSTTSSKTSYSCLFGLRAGSHVWTLPYSPFPVIAVYQNYW